MSAYDIIRDNNQFYRPSYMPKNGVDYIFSPSRTHIAALEENGEFVIYAGESPDDATKQLGWSSGAKVPPGYQVVSMGIRKGPFDNRKKNLQIFMGKISGGSLTQLWASGGSGDLQSPMEVTLRDDGNLSLRQNKDGEWQEIWNNGYSNPVVEFVVEAIEYDIPRSKMQTDTQTDVLEQVLDNTKSNQDQTMTMRKDVTTTVTSTWSNATGFTATISGEVTSGVPGVASAKVSMSASVQNTFTLGGSKSKSDSVGFNFNLNVPKGTKYRGWANIQTAEFEVPYTVTGELRFKSGRKVRHTLSGIYHGKTGYLGLYHVEDVTTDEHKPVMFFVSEGADGPIPVAHMIE